jgi:putative transposase
VLVELIATDDQVVEISKPHNRSPWLTSEQVAKIPGTLTVRVLRYRVEEKGFRSRQIVLMTTLLDPVKYPAADIAELYRARWQVEVNLRNLKQTLGMNSLHCKTVDGVTRELLMFALVYNAVCAVMGEAARRQNVPIDRVSFIDAMRWLQLSVHQPELPRLKVNPRRAARLHPRMLKRRLKFPKLQVSRSQWRAGILAAEP